MGVLVLPTALTVASGPGRTQDTAHAAVSSFCLVGFPDFASGSSCRAKLSRRCFLDAALGPAIGTAQGRSRPLAQPRGQRAGAARRPISGGAPKRICSQPLAGGTLIPEESHERAQRLPHHTARHDAGARAAGARLGLGHAAGGSVFQGATAEPHAGSAFVVSASGASTPEPVNQSGERGVFRRVTSEGKRAIRGG